MQTTRGVRSTLVVTRALLPAFVAGASIALGAAAPASADYLPLPRFGAYLMTHTVDGTTPIGDSGWHLSGCGPECVRMSADKTGFALNLGAIDDHWYGKVSGDKANCSDGRQITVDMDYTVHSDLTGSTTLYWSPSVPSCSNGTTPTTATFALAAL